MTSWAIPASGDQSGTCAITGGTGLKCSFGDLPTPSTRTVIVETAAAADLSACSQLMNTATVTGDNVLTKAETGDTACADFTIVKTPDGGTYKVGDKVRFTMVVTATAGTPKNEIGRATCRKRV